MYIPILYNIRPVYIGADLFTAACYYKKWEAVCDVIDDDNYNRRKLEFVSCKKGGIKCKCDYDKYKRGFAIMKLWKSKKITDSGMIVVNVKSHYYDPYVVVALDRHAFMTHHDMAQMLKNAINKVFENTDMKIDLVHWKVSAEERRVIWAKDCMMTYFKALFSDNKPAKVLRKSDNFDDYIKHSNKELVKSVLHKKLSVQNCPKDIARPIRILCDHGVLNWPPYNAFIKEFSELEGLISYGRYNHYTYEFTNPYEGDDRYGEVENELGILL